jgi:hypothetical protein
MNVRLLLKVAIAIFFLVFGCINKMNNIVPEEIWDGLIDLNDVRANTKFLNMLKEKDYRIRVLEFVDHQLNANHLSDDYQLRLAGVVNGLKMAIPDTEVNEKEKIREFIKNGRKYPTFYGGILSVDPYYLLDSLEVFKNEKDIYAFFPHPDGLGSRYIVQDLFLYVLKTATKEDFGKNYDKWKEWWERNGRYLKYNKNEMEYY